MALARALVVLIRPCLRSWVVRPLRRARRWSGGRLSLGTRLPCLMAKNRDPLSIEGNPCSKLVQSIRIGNQRNESKHQLWISEKPNRTTAAKCKIQKKKKPEINKRENVGNEKKNYPRTQRRGEGLEEKDPWKSEERGAVGGGIGWEHGNVRMGIALPRSLKKMKEKGALTLEMPCSIYYRSHRPLPLPLPLPLSFFSCFHWCRCYHNQHK